jgi:hypothetical protein
MPGPEAKVDVDTGLEELLARLQEQLKTSGEAVLKGEQTTWLMPEKGGDNGWEGDLFAINDMGKPFDRQDLNDKIVEGMTDAESPGTTGDLTLGTLQIAYLSAMQRAFIARHTMRRPRALMQMAARQQAHGAEEGPLVQGVLEHFRGLAARSKSA